MRGREYAPGANARGGGAKLAAMKRALKIVLFSVAAILLFALLLTFGAKTRSLSAP